MKTFFKIIVLILLLPLLYMLGVLLVASLTDFQPEKQIPLESEQLSKQIIIDKDELSFAIWNVGYAGLGAEMAFFFDAGHYYTSGNKQVRDSEANVKENVAGTVDFIHKTDLDFYLFQEVDIDARRSYGINQNSLYGKAKPEFANYFFKNFDVKRVPIPICEPWNAYGHAVSGLTTLSRFQPNLSTRLQLPGKFDWPDRIFQLDRCIGYQSYPLDNGKELIVLNIHNSAYDKGGFMKKQQMKYFRKLILKEYKAGNYVVAGGDWNQCPPDVDPNIFVKEKRKAIQSNIKSGFLPEGWQWIYDKSVATNRKLNEKFVAGQTITALIDFFLISPNIELVEVKGVDMAFAYSDHQPVTMKVKLKD